MSTAASASALPQRWRKPRRPCCRLRTRQCMRPRPKGAAPIASVRPDSTAEAKRRQKLEVDLRKAVAREEFVLHYQPIVSADTGRITAMEALLRWNHPEEALVFLPVHSRSRRTRFDEEGRPMGADDRLPPECGVAASGSGSCSHGCNVSAQQFHRGDIVRAVTEALDKSGLDPCWLELEITESLTLDDTENTILIMRDLKLLGRQPFARRLWHGVVVSCLICAASRWTASRSIDPSCAM